MVFTESQRLSRTELEQGYLSDSHTHGQFSESTGTSRNQISSNAGSEIINLEGEPLPTKSAVPLNSNLEDLPIKKRVKRQRPPEGVSKSIDPDIQAAIPVKKKKSRKRFTENQRNVLKILWERGFLCDKEHYKSISEITGLTTKQISGWASRSKNKCGEDYLPLKNPAPIATIFKDLSDCIRSCSVSVKPKPIPQALHFPSYAAGTIKRDIGVSPLNSSPQLYQQNLSFKNKSTNTKFLPPQFIPINGPRTDNRKPKNNSQSRYDFAMKYNARNVTPITPINFEPQEICTRSKNKAVELLGPKTYVLMNQFKISEAVQGINELSDAHADLLARTTGMEPDEVRWWLLSHGWLPTPAKHGILYKRIV